MDPNYLAVNSAISSYLTDDASELYHDTRSRTLASLDGISFWYRSGVHDKRSEHV